MPTQIGSINSSGRPCIKVKISGAYPEFATEFEAVIDTGFTGFISMPFVQAFPLGLPLTGTTPVVLADGNVHEKFMAICSAQLEGGTTWEAGVVILEPTSTDILLGMEFMQKFQKTLFVDANESRCSHRQQRCRSIYQDRSPKNQGLAAQAGPPNP
jgi:predicted aspartyl protease